MSDADSSLRGFLARVAEERPADLVEVERQVDPRYETTAIVAKLEERRRSPILLFRNVKDCQIPLVTNVCGSMGRLALALRCPLKEVAARYGEAAGSAIPPTLVSDAPVHAHVLRGQDVDLSIFPRLVYHADDADAPYLTAAIAVARDPDTGVINLSYHRMMGVDRRRTAIYMERGRHLHGIFAKYRARGQDMPIAVVIGVHPLVSLGTLYAGSADVDEYAIIGGLLGAPLPVVHTVTGTKLPVPAGAEWVLEGRVSVTETVQEGPFGEFTGYGTGKTDSPVFEVEAMTHRETPMFQDIISGHLEHLVLSMPAIEHRTLRDARAACSAVTRVSLPAPLTSVVALRKTDDAQPGQIIEALLSGDIYAKQVIVVDDDIDPSDLREVLAAAALQCQPGRDVVIRRGMQGTPMDPSCPSDDGVTSKIGIDATRKLAGGRTVTRNRIPAEIYDAVDVSEFKRRRG